MVRRVYPTLIANELLGIQPMTMPTGFIYPNDDVVDEWISPGESGWSITELMSGNASVQQRVDQIQGDPHRADRAHQPEPEHRRQVEHPGAVPGSGREPAGHREAREHRAALRLQCSTWVIPLRNMKSTPK